MSDNEIASNNTTSPNSLPYGDLNILHKLHPDDNYLERDEKIQIPDKYLYSFVPEEEYKEHNATSPSPYMLSAPSRILNSSLSHHSQGSNHETHSVGGNDRYGSLKRGQHQMPQQGYFLEGQLGIPNSFERYGSLRRGQSLHGSYHDNLNVNGLDRYGSLKRHNQGKITPTLLEDSTDYIITPIGSRMQPLSTSLGQDLQYSNELAALRTLQLQQQQMHYEQTIAETE